MNERYLFRGRIIDLNEWVRGSVIEKDTGTFIIYYENGIEGRFKIIPETVGRCTGLKDINGVKIFEGDIVKDERGNIGVILYSKHFCEWRIDFYKGRKDLLLSKFGVDIFTWIYPEMLLEIIGNKYDNPDLLEEKAWEER